MRGPVIGFVAGALAVVLAGGGYLIDHAITANQNNTPIATSSHAKSGGITVAGHGIQMRFPAGWENVPTSPNQLRQFIKNLEAQHRQLPAAVQSDINNAQFVSSVAMLVFRSAGQGAFRENLNAIVEPGQATASEMLAQLKAGQGPAQFGATDVQYSVTTFGQYPGVLVTYALDVQGVTVYGAQSYLIGPQDVVITTVTSQAAATSASDLKKIVDTIRFT